MKVRVRLKDPRRPFRIAFMIMITSVNDLVASGGAPHPPPPPPQRVRGLTAETKYVGRWKEFNRFRELVEASYCEDERVLGIPESHSPGCIQRRTPPVPSPRALPPLPGIAWHSGGTRGLGACDSANVCLIVDE